MNDKEFDQFLAWVKDRPIQMRFIELMQTGEMDSFFKKTPSFRTSISAEIATKWLAIQHKSHTDGPAKVFTHPDYAGEIGLIMPYEKNFLRKL